VQIPKLSDAFYVRYSLRRNKQLSIELQYKVAQLEGSSAIDKIKLRFAVRIKKGHMKDAVE
jgi:hypothetical protein